MPGDVADSDPAAGSERDDIVIVAPDLCCRDHDRRDVEMWNRKFLWDDRRLDAGRDFHFLLEALALRSLAAGRFLDHLIDQPSSLQRAADQLAKAFVDSALVRADLEEGETELLSVEDERLGHDGPRPLVDPSARSQLSRVKRRLVRAQSIRWPSS